MDMDDLKRFSVELAHVMDDIGVNEELVSLRRHVSRVNDRYKDIIEEYGGGKCLRFLTFGSQNEGSTTIGMKSDFDQLIYHEEFVACVHLSDCQDSTNIFLVIREKTSLPQCCCLQVCKRLNDHTFVPVDITCITDTHICEKTFICDKHGRLLLNSMFKLHILLQDYYHDTYNLLTKVRQHGPAITIPNIDSVYAVHCPTLPDNCRVLFTRPRPGHWPKQGTLSKAEQCEVYMVTPGVLGHTFGYDGDRQISFIKLQYQQKFVDSQFRMSTNMTERLLMFDLNIVQMKTYVITKMIRKEFLQPLVNENLSTFHMKTALLFTIEQFPEEIWINDNLVQCVIYCLNTLRRFLKRGYCPHYTISSVNLFAGKLKKNELQIVKENVTEIIKSGLCCLRKLCMDDVGLRLSERLLCVRNDNIAFGSTIRFQIITQMVQQLRRDCNRPRKRTYHELKMEAFKIKSALATEHEYKNELEFIFQSMCSNVASQEASDCLANGREVTNEVIDMYETSLRSNDISNHLRYASMLVCTRQFERACVLLENIENIIKLSKIYQRSKQCTSTEILIENAGHILFSYCCARSEMNCVPGHLIYEMYRAISEEGFKCEDLNKDYKYYELKTDVEPFLYYLQYLSSNNTYKKKLALEKLSDYCLSDLQNKRRDLLATALNMLGHVFELENCLPYAWRWYRRSINTQSHFNAAYWHLFRLFGHVVYKLIV